MKLYKTFKNIEDQKNILESRNIEVDDINVLRKINYSHLIYKFGSIYKINDKENKTKKYKNKTKITHIYNLYLFNAKLSQLLFSGIGHIEHELKTTVALVLSKIDPLFHTKFVELCKPSKTVSRKEIKKFQENINECVERNIKNYHEEYLIKKKHSYLIIGRSFSIWST